jgi:hypothetical protein
MFLAGVGCNVCRIPRELQEISQNDLSRRSGIPRATVIENDPFKLGVERARVLPEH